MRMYCIERILTGYRLSNSLKLGCIVMMHELHDVCNIINIFNRFANVFL